MSEKVYQFPEEALLWVRPNTKAKEVDKTSYDAYVELGGNMDIEDKTDSDQIIDLLKMITNEKIVILSDDGKVVGCMLKKYKPEPLKPISDDVTKDLSKKLITSRDKNYYVSFVPECEVESGEIKLVAHLHANPGTSFSRGFGKDNEPIETRITPFDENGHQIKVESVDYELFAGKDKHQQSILLTIEDENGSMYEKQIEVNCETGEWQNEDDFCVKWQETE